MASRNILIDDIDGTSDDVRTVPFSVDQHEYSIDLTDANRSRLYDALEEFMAAGRRVSNGVKTHTQAAGRKRPAPRIDPEQLAAIRAWARARGMTVNDRGRVPGAILDAYNNQTVEGQSA